MAISVVVPNEGINRHAAYGECLRTRWEGQVPATRPTGETTCPRCSRAPARGWRREPSGPDGGRPEPIVRSCSVARACRPCSPKAMGGRAESPFRKLLAEVRAPGFRPPPFPTPEMCACVALEAIVEGSDRIRVILPELEYLRYPRPPDTEPAWERMGDPVRCRAGGGVEITMWPWFDFETGREYVEILVVHVGGRACFVSAALRGHYRDKIRSGFFGEGQAPREPSAPPQPKRARGRGAPKG